jgi:hypothetical protein
VLTLSECFDDESEGEEAEEEDIELFEGGRCGGSLSCGGRDVRSHCVSYKGRGRSARDRREGSTYYSAAQLAGPLENSRKFYSAFWDFGLGAFFNLTFGTDSSLTTGTGWDNVTGMGTPNGLAFIRAVAK